MVSQSLQLFIFPKLGSHPWKHSSMAETEKCALAGTLSCSPSCVNMDLGPELFPYIIPWDCLVMTLLRLCLLLLVRQKRARSYWKSILGKETQAGQVGPCWGVPSACCLWPCNPASALILFISLLHLPSSFGIGTTSY